MAMIAPTVDSVGDATLTNSIIDRSITELQDNIITTPKKYALQDCAALKKVVFGEVTRVGTSTFCDCTALEVADFHQAVAITSGAFSGCKALKALILRSTTQCTLSSATGLGSTGISAGTGYIYVPSALVDTYKADSKFGTYAARIRAIEEWPEVCSTVGKVWAANGSFARSESVVFANGVFVLGMAAGIRYSLDGKSWANSNITGSGYFQVAYGDGLFVAARGYSSGPSFYYSEDGKAWTAGTLSGVTFGAVTYANGLWVAGADSAGIYYSEDGITWTQSDLTSSGEVLCVAYGEGLWVAGTNGNGFYYSEDGKTWTQSNITSDQSKCVAYADGLWVGGNYSSGFLYSTDGKVWTQSNITNQKGNCLIHENGVWVIGCFSGVYHSADGITWTKGSGYTGICLRLVFADGTFVLATSGKGIYYSTDGISWNPTNVGSSNYGALAYGNSILVAFKSSETGTAYYSE